MGSATLQTARKLIKCITAPVLFLSVGIKLNNMILIDEKVKKYEAKAQEKKTAIFELRQKLNSNPELDKEDMREEIENCKYDVRLFESFIRDLKEINAECEMEK